METFGGGDETSSLVPQKTEKTTTDLFHLQLIFAPSNSAPRQNAELEKPEMPERILKPRARFPL